MTDLNNSSEISSESSERSPSIKPDSNRWTARKDKLFLGLAMADIAILCVLFIGMSALTIGIKFSIQRPNAERMIDAGHLVLTTSHNDGGYVETDRGVFFLDAPFSSFKSAPLTLEIREDQRRYLCTQDLACTRLSGTTLITQLSK